MVNERKKEKQKGFVTLILLFSVFIILALYLVVNLYTTSVSTTTYSEKKTNSMLLCSNLNNPITDINYNKETNTLNFIFENNVEGLTIHKITIISDLKQNKTITINKQFGKYSLELPINKKFTASIDECGFKYEINV